MFQRCSCRFLSLVWTWIALAQFGAHHVNGRIGPQNIVSRQYIVYFSDDIDEALVPEKAADMARQAGGQILWIYQHALKGVALEVKSGFRLKDLLNIVAVASIDEVRWGFLFLGLSIPLQNRFERNLKFTGVFRLLHDERGFARMNHSKWTMCQ
jgi:hypothetical protein